MEAAVGTDLDQVWRGHWGRLLALLVAQFRRLDLAEDALAEAFEQAARRWPEGMPDNPPAWLLTAARRRVLDRLRAEAMAAKKEPLLIVESEVQQQAQTWRADAGDEINDELLRLVFLCAHPALAPDSATALTLRMVVGLPTPDIARLFLVSTPTMAARLTRARKKLVGSGVPFTIPPADALGGRVATAADVAYLAFTVGYAPGSGPDVVRVSLAGEAIRLVRLLRELLRGQPMLDALLALMLLQHSRRDARTSPTGELVLLPDQDRDRWHHDEIDEAVAILAPMLEQSYDGRADIWLTEALIGAEHAVASRVEETSWSRIADHYSQLESLTGSPVVRLNRAVAVAESEGPEAGLALLETLEESLPRHHRLAATRAELLARAGRTEEARTELDRAIDWAEDGAERDHLVTRRRGLG